MIERCSYDGFDMNARTRAAIRNDLGQTFDSRFISLFSGYEADILELPTVDVADYDPERVIADPYIQQFAHGRYEQFVSLEVSAAPPETDFRPLKVPVGEYGQEAAMALVLAGSKLVEHIADKQSEPLSVHERITVNNHTYYGRTQKYGTDSFLANKQQGVAFTIHALAALTAQKVKGYDTVSYTHLTLPTIYSV